MMQMYHGYGADITRHLAEPIARGLAWCRAIWSDLGGELWMNPR
jgi:hypothetical protein